jgi:hypothetical protein
MKQLVQGYGIHRQDDLVFLHEGDGARCLTPGLADLDSPFEVIRVPRQRCPHILPPPALGELERARLVRVMVPTPKRRLYWVDPAQGQSVFEMAQHMVGRPHDPPVVFWNSMFNPLRTLTPKLTLTNCLPLVIAGYQVRDFMDLMRLCELPRTRAIVVVGQPKPPRALDITPPTPVTPRSPDAWRALAAAHLHDFIQRVTRT